MPGLGRISQSPIIKLIGALPLPRNDKVGDERCPTVPLDCRVGALPLLAMTGWERDGRGEGVMVWRCPASMLLLRAR